MWLLYLLYINSSYIPISTFFSQTIPQKLLLLELCKNADLSSEGVVLRYALMLVCPTVLGDVFFFGVVSSKGELMGDAATSLDPPELLTILGLPNIVPSLLLSTCFQSFPVNQATNQYRLSTSGCECVSTQILCFGGVFEDPLESFWVFKVYWPYALASKEFLHCQVAVELH